MKSSKPLNLQEHRCKNLDQFVCKIFCTSLLNVSKQVYISNFTDTKFEKKIIPPKQYFALFVFTTSSLLLNFLKSIAILKIVHEMIRKHFLVSSC